MCPTHANKTYVTLTNKGMKEMHLSGRWRKMYNLQMNPIISQKILTVYTLLNCVGPLTFPVFLPGRRSRGAPSSLPLSVSLSPASPCWLRDSVSDWTCDGVSEFWFSGDEEREGDSRKRFMAGWFSTDGSLLEAWTRMTTDFYCLVISNCLVF